MGLRSTHGNESQAFVNPAQAGVHLDSRSPAFAEDKLRGSDPILERAKRGNSP